MRPSCSWNSSRPVVAGAFAGVVVAMATSTVLSGVLFGISPLDPVGIGGAVAFLLGAALLASLPAARRGAHCAPRR